MFSGVFTALVTPFTAKGEVDYKCLENLIEWQITEGIHGLVICGTTAETPTLSKDEKHKIIKAAIAKVAGRVPVIVGTGTNSTYDTMEETKFAKEAGADAALVVCPYYNKPSQDGLYRHYNMVADIGLPVVVYNVPSRTVVDISFNTLKTLTDNKNIVAVKDATGDMARVVQYKNEMKEDFALLSGDDGTFLGFLAQGGHGCISVTANVAPKKCVELYNMWKKGDIAKVTEIRDSMYHLHNAMFVDVNPCPVKYALSALGKCNEFVRLPLLPLSAISKSKVDVAMEKAGIK